MKQRLLYLLRFYLTTILLFIAAKVVFMLACHEGQAPFTAADVWQVVRHGLTLDLSTALYFLIVPFLYVILSVWMKLPRWLLTVYNVIVAVAFALAFVADTSLYPFWQFKLDASCLQYLSTPTEAMASVTTGYLLERLATVILVAAVIFRLFRSAAIPLFRNNVISEFRYSVKLRLAETLFYFLCIPLIVVGIRGGLSESTTNIGQVYYSQNQFLNHSAINPVFSFLYSLSHQTGDLDDYRFLDEEECRQLVADIFTTESLDADTLLNTRRPNIIVVLMESAGEEFADVMPRLQQLKREGVSFSRCYGNSWRTDRGTVATLSGYPTFPTLSVMKMPEKSRTLPSIARSLQHEGYATTYLYGGDINFTNMRSYLIATGWEQLISQDNYTAAERHSAQWGVRDDITMQTLIRLVDRHQDDGPFLIGFSTLSSHEPWDVPSKTIADDEVLNAFAYLDTCLGQLIDTLRQSPAWHNLLIVLTADHGINYGDINNATPLRKNHIPMLWVGGAVKGPRTVDVLCNQSDLSATLLGQLGLPHDDFSFSRDVLSSTYRHPTAVHNYSNAQMLLDSTGCILYDFDARQFIVSQAADADHLQRQSEAILQTTINDLKDR